MQSVQNIERCRRFNHYYQSGEIILIQKTPQAETKERKKKGGSPRKEICWDSTTVLLILNPSNIIIFEVLWVVKAQQEKLLLVFGSSSLRIVKNLSCQAQAVAQIPKFIHVIDFSYVPLAKKI